MFHISMATGLHIIVLQQGAQQTERWGHIITAATGMFFLFFRNVGGLL
jgi:hypothetical protein